MVIQSVKEGRQRLRIAVAATIYADAAGGTVTDGLDVLIFGWQE